MGAAASAVAAHLWFRPRPPTSQPVPATEAAASPDPLEPTIGPTQRSAESSRHDGAPLQTRPQAPQTATHEVAALLAIYDEMSDLLEASPEDCDALAYGLSTIIDAGALRVRVLSQRGGAAAELSDPALRAEATARLKRLGSAMNGVLPRCATQLNTELARLRELVAATSR